MMPHEFVGWTPPPGAVVDPPVHPKTTVKTFWSDDGFSEILPAGEFDWSAVGDGPRVVAYAVVQEYKPEPVLREWWITMHQGMAWDSEEQAQRNAYDGAIHHVREVPDPSREVVAWAVVRDGDATEVCFDEVDAVREARKGGTVVRLSGVMPNE